MCDENNKAELPDIKVMGFFCFKIPSDSLLNKNENFSLDQYKQCSKALKILYCKKLKG